MTATPDVLVSYHPAVDASRVQFHAPASKVTLLEDRALVQREGIVALSAGPARLVVWGLAPVLQDVSMRVSVVDGEARVVDTRVRRVVRVGHAQAPTAIAQLDVQLLELDNAMRIEADEQHRSNERRDIVLRMMDKMLAEVSQDAAWGLGHAKTWRETYDALSAKSGALQHDMQAREENSRVLGVRRDAVQARRAVLQTPTTQMACVLEIDLEAQPGPARLRLEYVVPNALWRPMHTASIADGELTMSTQAVVWQNTGEDWNDVEMSFSTARSSLGHEPPKLVDDALSAKKKDPHVVIQAREVQLQSAGMGAGATVTAPTSAGHVSLPGVDDGGDIQHLSAAAKVNAPSTGLPTFVPLFASRAPVSVEMLVMPELQLSVFVKATSTYAGTAPLLAGPVELLHRSGFVGTTRTLFVAPGERFQLGFGPDSDVRVQRNVDVETEVDDVDQWTRKTYAVSIFLSNLAPLEKALTIQERIPVSEIKHVVIALVADKTSGAPTVDADGIVTWTLVLPASGRLRLQFTYVVATAPDVK